MEKRQMVFGWLIVAAVVGLICPKIVLGADETTLTTEQIKTFLQKAKES